MLLAKRLLPFVMLAVLLGACGSGKQPTVSGLAVKATTGQAGKAVGAVAAPQLPGRLLITGESSLDLVENGKRTVIARAPNVSTYYEYPAFAPDGRSIAYIVATTPTGQGQDWGNDIYTANADGGNARLVFRHDKPGALLDSLSWTPDGSALVFAYSRTVYDQQGHYTGSIYQVQKLQLADGRSSTLIDNATQPSLSWDGKQVVYVDFPQNDFQSANLAIANSDGSGKRRLLSAQYGFQGFFAPHLSPDGKQVVFAAVGGPLGGPGSTPTPAGARRSGGLLPSLARLLQPAAAIADGSPYQIWIASLDGSSLHTVQNLREDLPFPVWSADGKTVLFLGSAGLYTAAADGTNLKRIGNGVPHGEIAWYQK